MNDSGFLYCFGISVKKHRIIAGLSQQQLGDRTSCDKNTIGRIERGETDLKMSTLHRLALGLETSCSRLLKEAELPVKDWFIPRVEYDYLRLFQYCRQLSPEQFNNLCNTAYLYVSTNEKTGSDPL